MIGLAIKKKKQKNYNSMLIDGDYFLAAFVCDVVVSVVMDAAPIVPSQQCDIMEHIAIAPPQYNRTFVHWVGVYACAQR